MRIDDYHISQAHNIFIHLQLADRYGVQQYDEHMPFRTGKAIGRVLRHDGSADEVYCHAATFTAWHRRIWNKRKKEIPFRAFEVFIESAGVWRIGFTSIPE